MASIADVFVRALLEDKQLQIDAAKSGDKAGQTIGSRIATGLQKNSRAVTAFGAGVGVALAGASEAAINFEDQLRTIQTVVPDIDIAKLGSDIKNLAAETGKSTDDLTAGFYDLVSAGVDADQAINVLRDSAKFATGALGSTAESVDLVTSVMNAYGLEAKDSARITDVFAKAVADGKVTAAELGASIATIAPIAASAGVSMEEVSSGFATLTAKGVPAAEAATQMRSAIVALLTPNAALNKIQEETGINFAELAKTKGLAVALDTLRESVGGNAEEFGNALGRVEAYQFALATTGDNAEAFAGQIVETSNSVGLATDQYNIKSQSMAEQAKRTAAQLNNLVLGVGEAIGPFGQLFFAVNQMAPAFRGLISPAKALGGVLGGLFAKGSVSIVKRLEGLFQDISLGRRTGVAGAVSRAGAFVGRVFSLAFTVATKVGDAIATAFNAVPGSTAVKNATAKIGNLLGGKLGGALKVGLLAVAGTIIIELFNEYQRQLEERKAQFNQIGADVGNEIVAGTTEQLEQSKAALQKGIEDLGFFDFLLGSKDGGNVGPLKEQLARVEAELARRAEGAGSAIPEGLATGLLAGANALADAAQEGLSDPILGVVGDIPDAAGDAVKPTTKEIADSLRGGRFRVKDATADLKQAFKDAISPTKEIARIEAFLAGDVFQKALNSKKPEVRAAAQAWKEAAEDRLFALRNNVPEIALETGQDYATALESKKAESARAAAKVAAAVANTLGGLHLRDEGADAGDQFADGLESQIRKIAQVAARIAAAVAANLHFGSPTKEGPFSEDGGPEGWGQKGATDWVKGWRVDPTGEISSFAQRAANALAAPFTSPALAMAGAAMAGTSAPAIGGMVINGGVHVDARGARDPQAVRAATQQGIEDAMATALRSQTARLPVGGRS